MIWKKWMSRSRREVREFRKDSKIFMSKLHNAKSIFHLTKNRKLERRDRQMRRRVRKRKNYWMMRL
jgi:hypothetical protein